MSKDGSAIGALVGVPGATAQIIALELGGQTIELLDIQPRGRSYPEGVAGWSPLFQHFAIVVSDMADACGNLSAQAGWTPISTEGPQLLPASSGGVTAYKFRDPAGHPLELIAFPRHAVPERWQKTSASGFLGIDHSAISVANSPRSIDFYRRLGLRRAGGSHNAGLAQDKLDGVDRAVVEVTALAPMEATPHVELLCYRGIFARDTPFPDINDVAATQLVLSVEDPNALDALRAENMDAVFTGPVLETDAVRAMLRDPDGHLLCLEAPL
jgi:catechol 2,3-dioxygenase-like lactoylglutathione lyase family enzyme